MAIFLKSGDDINIKIKYRRSFIMNIKEKLQQMEASKEFFDMTDEYARTTAHKNRFNNPVECDDSDMKIWNGKDKQR